MECKNLCGKALTGRQKEFCSDKCRMAYSRKVEHKPEQVKVEQGLTAAQLYSAINAYPEDTWKDSVEYKELMRRLHSMSIDELKAGGYDVPCWKYSEAA